MNEEETTGKTQDPPRDEGRTIANMDEFDFLDLLRESRII